MTGITVKELLEATGGNLLHGQEDQHVKHISLDSRKTITSYTRIIY